ncbi:hypothetical protein [Hymenobacter rubripertinctus]|uniref:DUF4252 domain-containing protein n=1 Tax=Hymenobacter rubripertinctus TaxID=2029981 RepID=A0A418R7S0_9BACT|nr:hypothetical protein [Hymenobacter rubripertinctus]RIY13344.1 hypothetical protein D0T11_02610 [Hymenobacter rubripertinctus]
MKKLLLLAALALAGPRTFAQLPALHAQPDKQDDTIVLTLPDEGRAAWQRAAGVLAARGYTFRYSDADLLTLSTDYIILERMGPIGVFVRVEGHQLLVRCRYLNSADDSISKAQAVRMGGLLGTSREWPELVAIARELGGTAAYYNSGAY